jgi:hypothetical protein
MPQFVKTQFPIMETKMGATRMAGSPISCKRSEKSKTCFLVRVAP